MKVAVLGSGSWGTALGMIANKAGHKTIIWSRNGETASEINNKKTNRVYLPGIILPSDIAATTKFADILDSDILMLTIPAQSIRNICEELAHLNLSQEKQIIICAKGIEQKTLKLMSEVVEEILPHNPVAILSGPNFALEIAQNLPAISSIASSDRELSIDLANKLSNPNFRIYPSQDVVGTQLIGSAKNVLAIATGIVIGCELGENAKSAIFSRGIDEINRLILAKGGKIATMFSPAGIGDLNLTCSSATSRNTSFGISLAKGIKNSNHLVEGYFTASSIYSLAKLYETEMPVIDSVYKILYENCPVTEIIDNLLKRPVTSLY
jgi:glycerol-3-phosphate dehydrogenase (NAD(P)+)